MGSIVQISVSRGGLPKQAVPEGEVTPLGIAGDVQAHAGIHGGPQQAVLLITSEGIAELIALGFPLYHGALGENVTTQGIDRREWRVGQRWRLGDVIVELTKLREPCSQLNVYGTGIQKAIYAEDASSPRWGLSGFYASVVRPGMIYPGAPVSLLSAVA